MPRKVMDSVATRQKKAIFAINNEVARTAPTASFLFEKIVLFTHSKFTHSKLIRWPAGI